MTNSDETSKTWRSLFLPLGTDERVVFSSFFTSLSAQVLNAMHVINDADTQREAIICVNENQSVCIFDLSSGDTGPKKVSSFKPAREMKAPMSDASDVVATCASLIPLELSYFCQYQASAVVQLTTSDEADDDAREIKSSTTLRGVVGSSNGRVDVFMESSYAFGFPAHKCPIAHVQALYVGESAAPAVHPEGKQGGNVALSNFASTTHQADSSNRTIGSSASKGDFLGSISSTLGFVTMGVDGVVFVWRRREDGFRREKLVEPNLFSKCHAIHATLPARCESIQLLTVNDAHLEAPSTPAPDEGRGEVGERPLYSPSHAEGSPSEVRLRKTSNKPRGYRLHPSLIFSGGNGFSNTVKVRSCESMKEVELDVSLDGVFSRTSAIAVDGPTCIVAREKVVYAIDYIQRTCKRIFTATSCVKHLAIRLPLVVAGCESGKIYVVNASLGVVLGTSYTYSAAPVISLSFVYSALLVAVVDDTKCVEIFQLPDSYLRHSVHKRLCAFDAQHFAATDVLQKYVALQECSTGDGTAAVARSVVAEEQLLLARLLVPEEVTRYLRIHHRVL